MLGAVGHHQQSLRAVVDGQAEISQVIEKRTRVGTSEHAEYYTDDEKVALEGGHPKFVDSLKGKTEEERRAVTLYIASLMKPTDSEAKSPAKP